MQHFVFYFFLRDECDRLINIVNSRVIGYSINEAEVNGLHADALRDIGNGTVLQKNCSQFHLNSLHVTDRVLSILHRNC